MRATCESSEEVDPIIDQFFHIPSRLRGRVAELVDKAEPTGIHPYRVHLCAWLLVAARHRPETDFPPGKNVPMPNYLIAGALHGIHDEDDHPEEVARTYARGRKASQRVQAAAKGAFNRFDKVLQRNYLELPVWTREEAQQVRLSLKRFAISADPGEDLLRRVRAKDEHEIFSCSSLALLWWRYYLHSPRNQYWSDMLALAKIWGVSSPIGLKSFMRRVRELSEGKEDIPTPPFVPGTWCPLS